MSNYFESLILEHLLKLQNRDGGWGSSSGQQSNPEATACALMTLAERQHRFKLQPQVKAALRWLLSQQDTGGAWFYNRPLRQGAWVTAPVVLALSPFKAYQPAARRGAAWLLQQRGERLSFLQAIRFWLSDRHQTAGMNPNLQGWSWVSGTTSWVEPTAYALMALHKLGAMLDRQVVDERICHGEALLYNRMCVNGGWNYGNAVVLDQALVPFPDTTAMSLIALQAHRDRRENQMSLNVLNKIVEQERSGLSLSWAAICRIVYGQPAASLQSQLLTQYQTTMFLGQTKPIALSLLALGETFSYFQA